MNKPTRREALAASFEEAEKQETEQEVAPVEAEKPAEKPRDETGKFAKAEKTEKSDTSEASVAADDKYTKPPKSWKQDFHTHYSGLAPEVRAYLHQREDEQNKGVEPLKQRAQRAEMLEQALGPVAQELAQRGVGLDGFLRDIGQTVWTLARGTPDQKRMTLQNIARQYGVEMAQQAAEAAQQQSGNQNPELGKLQAELAGLKDHLMRQQQANEQAEWAKVNESIAKFANDAENYPHFSAVRVTMGRLLQTGEADSMETAYSKAVRLHDDIWQQEQERQRAADEAKRKAEKDAAAKAARAAAVSPRSASPAGASADDTGTRKGRRATVADAVDRLMGGGRV